MFSIKIKTIYLLIYLNIIQTHPTSEHLSCGSAAKLPRTNIIVLDQFNSSVDSTIKIQYKCDNENNLLVGNNIRQCNHVYWTGDTPRCGNYQVIFKKYDLDQIQSSNKLWKPFICLFLYLRGRRLNTSHI